MFDTTDLTKSVGRLYTAYSDEWLEWLPETIRVVINNRWGGIDDIDMERILATRNIIIYEYFWHDVDIFEATIMCFNWIEIDHRLGIHPSPGQVVYGIDLARKVKNPECEFSEDVNQYIASIFIDKCYVYIPPAYGIPGVQKYLDKYYKDVELKKAIRMKYELRVRDDISLEENLVDAQVAKLLAINKFVEIGGIESPHSKENILAKVIME
ncbi:MAG: hypothetical protein WCY30_05815 [Candidatus Neomarinimicrobiota bacterium]|jgi:hypothetical protein